MLGTVCATAATAEQPTALSYTVYGTPGLIEMPTAESAPDAELAFSGGWMDETQHYTLTFQILPRLSGSFRYSRIKLPGDKTFTRSFDLRYRFMDEGDIMPAMAIGFQDFIGTGQYSGEYIVATKHITPRLTFTGGIGWGRFGSYKGMGNPLRALDSRFRDRPSGFSARGGTLEAKKWFRGDIGLFGGVAWKATDKLVLKAEYSSDAHGYERGLGHFKHKMPVNFGLDYQINKAFSLQGFYLYGDQIGAALTVKLNPKDPPANGDITPGPVPVKPRDAARINEMAWAESPERLAKLREALARVLGAEGITLEAAEFDPRIVTVRIRNTRYNAPPEAIGRTARIMTQVLPASVSEFRIVPVNNGMALSAVSLRRGDLEQLEHAPDGAWQSYVRAGIADHPYAPARGSLNPEQYPKFTWGFGPDVSFSYFDPDNPLRYDLGVKLDAAYTILPGLTLAGTVKQSLYGTKDDVSRPSNSVLPHVRTDTYLYDRENAPRLDDLTLSYMFRPGENLYGRVTAGYLERMFGGGSAELLWKPVDSRLALGIEANYVWQRDHDQRFGFGDYDYKTFTGHASAYYDLGNGFNVQLDGGRYLARDWGGTLTITRRFANGWTVGAYATKTDISSAEFGEGSFDKGIMITAPLGYILGRPSRNSYSTTIQPLTRDGGARLHVPGRLYGRVREYHQPELKERWGTFWR